jgi:arabinofuranosyltransferase
VIEESGLVAVPRYVSAFLSSDGMFARYGASFVPGWIWVAGAGVCLALFGVAARFGLPKRYAKYVGLALGALIVVGAIVHAWQLAWVCDDAFISFRYADNWAHGRGLVYNPGERVEGYTNFLWTAVLTLGILVGIEPGHFALVLSLACLAAVLAMGSRLAWRLLPEGAPLPGILCAAGLASSYVFTSYGTSGLETMAAALCVLVAAELAEAKSPLAAGIVGILATLLHPDHLIFYVALGAVLAIGPAPRLPRLLRYAAPFVFLFVPYYIARWVYYGDLFPNTYYAKSAGALYFSQGGIYLAMCGLIAGLLGVLPLSVFGLVITRKTLFTRFMMLSLPLYLVYVAKVGGDFMLGRLLCSALPPLFLAAEVGVRRLLAGRLWPVGVVGLLSFAPIALPNGVVKPYEKYEHVADERTFYPLKSFEPLTIDASYTAHAKRFKRMFKKPPRAPRLAIGAIGIVGYFTGFNIQDTLGLVNKEVARIKIKRRSRPGHEKIATPGHVLDFNADYSDVGVWPKEYAAWTKFNVDSGEFFVVRYDPVLTQTSRPEVARVPNMEALAYNYSPLGRPREKVACDVWFFHETYFRQTRNEPLRRRFTNAVLRSEPALADVEELVVGPLPKNGQGWQARRLFGFDDLKGWSLTGDAFQGAIRDEDIPGQEHVYGAEGHYLCTFAGRNGDLPRGTARSPKFALTGDALTLLVAGGQSKRIQVRLWVGDEMVASATGCESEALGRRVFAIAAYRGREAQLEIVDEGDGGWEHIVVDEVVEWKKTP